MRFSFLLTCSVVPILSKSGYFGFFSVFELAIFGFFQFLKMQNLKKIEIGEKYVHVHSYFFLWSFSGAY